MRYQTLVARSQTPDAGRDQGEGGEPRQREIRNAGRTEHAALDGVPAAPTAWVDHGSALQTWTIQRPR
jgi:hypothetical protein